jgi:predicted AlkP superfamily phosphohydrolase/phosphomutase
MSRVLLIGLDAAEPRLIERWIDDGSLPTLRSLREQGAYTRLRSTADWLVGSTWPAFYTGRLPAETGLYHSIVWQPERMRHVRPGPDDLPLTPFWRGFGEHGPRTIALDVPLTQQPTPFNGIEINGWANTDLLAPPGSSPAGLFDRLRGEFEQPRQRRENYVLSPVDDLLAIRDEQIRNTGKVARLAEALLRRETWDLALVGFEATHLCGHKLWSDRNVRGEVPSERRDEFDRALQEVYRACDRALADCSPAARPRPPCWCSRCTAWGPIPAGPTCCRPCCSGSWRAPAMVTIPPARRTAPRARCAACCRRTSAMRSRAACRKPCRTR